MGWKLTMTVIDSAEFYENEKILYDLGFDDLEKIRPENLGDVFFPNSQEVYIGKYQNKYIINANELALRLIDPFRVKYQRLVLSTHFPDAEICSMLLNSVTNLWGYSIIKDYNVVRAIVEDLDNPKIVDIGEPTLEEKIVKENNSEFDGEQVVFQVFKKYFGNSLDQMSDKFYETEMMGYKFSGVSKRESIQVKVRKKKWWKRLLFTHSLR